MWGDVYKRQALDCTIDAAKHTQLEIPFKGNVDPDKLQKALTEYAERIPFIIDVYKRQILR